MTEDPFASMRVGVGFIGEMEVEALVFGEEGE